MKKISYFLLLILSIGIWSCDNNEKSEIITYKTTNVSITDLGKISTNPIFEINYNDSADASSCSIRTNLIKSGDNIDTITVVFTENILNMNIISTPNDQSCNEPSCFSIHDVKFDIIGLKKGNYKVNMVINNVYGKPFEYNIK